MITFYTCASTSSHLPTVSFPSPCPQFPVHSSTSPRWFLAPGSSSLPTPLPSSPPPLFRQASLSPVPRSQFHIPRWFLAPGASSLPTSPGPSSCPQIPVCSSPAPGSFSPGPCLPTIPCPQFLSPGPSSQFTPALFSSGILTPAPVLSSLAAGPCDELWRQSARVRSLQPSRSSRLLPPSHKNRLQARLVRKLRPNHHVQKKTPRAKTQLLSSIRSPQVLLTICCLGLRAFGRPAIPFVTAATTFS